MSRELTGKPRSRSGPTTSGQPCQARKMSVAWRKKFLTCLVIESMSRTYRSCSVLTPVRNREGRHFHQGFHQHLVSSYAGLRLHGVRHRQAAVLGPGQRPFCLGCVWLVSFLPIPGSAWGWRHLPAQSRLCLLRPVGPCGHLFLANSTKWKLRVWTLSNASRGFLSWGCYFKRK